MITSLTSVIITVVVIGIIAWLISRAPFINGEFKTIINYILLVVAVIIVITFLFGIIR